MEAQKENVRSRMQQMQQAQNHAQTFYTTSLSTLGLKKNPLESLVMRFDEPREHRQIRFLSAQGQADVIGRVPIATEEQLRQCTRCGGLSEMLQVCWHSANDAVCICGGSWRRLKPPVNRQESGSSI